MDQSSKPQKPRPDFPLFPHPCGRWCKKIKGRLIYFAKWDDPEGALAQYYREKPDWEQGRRPRQRDAVTLGDLCNEFLTSKRDMLTSGDITQRTWNDYKKTTDILISAFGKQRIAEDLDATDFRKLRSQLAARLGPVSLHNEIQRIRVVFKFGKDNRLLKELPNYGQNFKRPPKRVLRLHRSESGTKFLEASQIKKLLGAAGVHLKAMILLGINAGFGNADCGRIMRRDVDLDRGWIDFVRHKTGVHRRCPLWPETVAALRESLAKRPMPKDGGDLFFVTRLGQPWARDEADSPITKETAKLLKTLGMTQRGRNFYALRHTFRTVADATKDTPAIDKIMGHTPTGMAAEYRAFVDDDRLIVVSDHVRVWLFGQPNQTRKKHD